MYLAIVSMSILCMATTNVSGGSISAVCLASAQSSYMFTNTWEYELAQGGPHSSMKLISLSLHTNPAVLSMQMRGEKRGGLSRVCSVSASLLLHFKWINDKSPLFSPLVTVLHPSPFSFTELPYSPQPLIPSFLPFWVYCDFPLTAWWLSPVWICCFCVIFYTHIKRLIWQVGIATLAIATAFIWGPLRFKAVIT